MTSGVLVMLNTAVDGEAYLKTAHRVREHRMGIFVEDDGLK